MPKGFFGSEGLFIGKEGWYPDIEATELLRYAYDRGHLGVVLVGMLRLYEIFTDGSRPASELEQLWSRVGICEPLPSAAKWPPKAADRRAKVLCHLA